MVLGRFVNDIFWRYLKDSTERGETFSKCPGVELKPRTITLRAKDSEHKAAIHVVNLIQN